MITNRAELVRRDFLLTTAIEHQSTALFIVRFEGANPLEPPIVYVNPAFCELTGYAREEIAGGQYPVILGPMTERALIVDAARRVAAGEHIVVPEVQLYRKNGEPFWARVHSHPIEAGGPHGVLILEDITEQRDREQKLALLDEAVEQASDFVIVTDTRAHAEGGPRFVYLNRSFYEATGYTAADILGQPYTLIYSKNNDPAFMKAVRDTIEAGQPNYREMLAIRKDGSEFWIEFVAKPFEARGERYRLSIGRDITLRKRTFNQIALLFSALERSPNRVVLYEPDESGNLAVSYENERAAIAGKYRILNSPSAIKERLLKGETVQHIYAEEVEGEPAIVDFVATGIRNGNELSAVITAERVLARASSEGAYQSRLIAFARLLPALAEATSTHERLHILKALVMDAFEVDVSQSQAMSSSGVHIAPGSRTAYFSFAGQSYVATWPNHLEHASITALRFCIEAAIEQESLS